jgi:hypothetical protein
MRSYGTLLGLIRFLRRLVGRRWLSLERSVHPVSSKTGRAPQLPHTLAFGPTLKKVTRRWWSNFFSDYEERPPIPSVWPVKIVTNLTRSDIEALENAGFQLPQKQSVPMSRTFNSSAPPRDLSQVSMPDNADVYPKTRKSKNMRRSITCASSKHMQNIDSARAMKASILKVVMIPQPGFGCVVTLQSKPAPTESVYHLSISAYPNCNCPAFKDTMAKLGRRGCPFRPCKHLYYLYIQVCKLEADHDLFMHAPTLSFKEVKTILERGILAHATV